MRISSALREGRLTGNTLSMWLPVTQWWLQNQLNTHLTFLERMGEKNRVTTLCRSISSLKQVWWNLAWTSAEEVNSFWWSKSRFIDVNSALCRIIMRTFNHEFTSWLLSCAQTDRASEPQSALRTKLFCLNHWFLPTLWNVYVRMNMIEM